MFTQCQQSEPADITNSNLQTSCQKNCQDFSASSVSKQNHTQFINEDPSGQLSILNYATIIKQE